ANYYFGKTVGELSLPEAATLAGIFQRPSRYSPYNNAKAVLERRNHVLERMLEDGYIDRLQYHDAVGEPLKVVPHGPREESGSYFAEEIRRHLETTLGTTSLLEGGLKVETTLDLAIQRSVDQGLREGLLRLDHRRGYRGPQSKVSGKAEEAELKSWSAPRAVADNWFEGVVLESTPSSARIKHLDEVLTLTPEGIAWTGKTQPNRLLNRGDVAWFRIAPLKEGGPPILRLEQEPELQGAAMVIESATGAVRAMAGGWDFGRNQFNRATQARRQAGSAFKMFVYGTALENGYTPADTIFDAPVWLKGADGRLSYSPHNYYNTYYGIVTLQRALEQSFNVSAVKLSDAVGLDKVIQFARRAGISTDLPPYPSIALGAADLVPLELTAAYSSIANGGVWMEPYLLEKVATPEGNVLERHSPRTRLVTHLDVDAADMRAVTRAFADFFGGAGRDAVERRA
ncbi:MAG TPA: penicillin-binding transpeptidase domain-containing protein, partial [Thermoanaerobaculia bacterium]|nr:penicillin-binding transpeptidase domain-containing protein [Thermoanaerobaculia bacterium]